MPNPYTKNPHYPFSQLLRLLHVEHKPRDYQRVAGWSTETVENYSEIKQAYLALLPTYTYARCPVCQKECREQIDTYGLPLYSMRHSAYGPFPPNYPEGSPVPCQHYIGTHSFLHLHENLPTEVNQIISIEYGEVPYVTPWALVDDPESYAVLHALPILGIENKAFTPKYTHFIVTYFSTNPRQLIKQIYDSQSHNQDEVFRRFLAYPFMHGNVDSHPPSRNLEFIPAKYRPFFVEQYDLQHWAIQGKLGYLDYTSSNLPLKIGKDLILPDIYQDILGRRYRFIRDMRKS
jgi:hypothetical protein